MSRSYRITVKGSVQRVVHVEDGVCSSLELLPILPPDRTAEILAGELQRRGFTRDGGVAKRTEEDGVTIEIELATGTVSVKAEATENIAINRERTELVAEERIARGTKDAQGRVDRAAELDANEAEKRAREAVTAKLEKRLSDVRRELDAVSARVTADALKEKARSLGEIEEMVEDAESGELTIKVKL